MGVVRSEPLERRPQRFSQQLRTSTRKIQNRFTPNMQLTLLNKIKSDVWLKTNKKSKFQCISILYKQHLLCCIVLPKLSCSRGREEDQVHWTEIISIKRKLSCVPDNKVIVLRKNVRLNEEVLWLHLKTQRGEIFIQPGHISDLETVLLQMTSFYENKYFQSQFL